MTFVEKRVPRAVLEEFLERLADAEDPPVEAVKRLHAEMELQPRYGVPLPDLRVHVRTLRRRAERKPAVVLAAESAMDVSPEQRESWRTRLACAAEIARGVCDQLGAAEEGRIQRAARLVLVSRIFESLTQNEAELPTAELATLTRAYVAQQKTVAAETAPAQADPAQDGAALHASIRQLYGLSNPGGASEPDGM